MNLILIKGIGILVVITILFGLGWEVCSKYDSITISDLKLTHAKALSAATTAKDAAEARATVLEQKYMTDLGIATTTFEETRQNEKAAADRTIADLATRVTSLRVSTDHRPASSGALPGTTATTSCGDGPATETLSPAVAGRLARRYADYNEVVDELNLCQQTVTIDRSQ